MEQWLDLDLGHEAVDVCVRDVIHTGVLNEFSPYLVAVSVLADELARGDGSLQASLRSMLLDGSLQEVVSILSKALFGEPMVGSQTAHSCTRPWW